MVSQACIADITGTPISFPPDRNLIPFFRGEPHLNWFFRADYAATNYMGANDDPRCPMWSYITYRRTYNIRNGRIIKLDRINHNKPMILVGVVHSDIVINEPSGEKYHPCTDNFMSIDGGLSRDIAKFLYFT